MVKDLTISIMRSKPMKSFIATSKLRKGHIAEANTPFCNLRKVKDTTTAENLEKLLSHKWEWFNPQKLTMREYSALPSYFRLLVRNMDQDTWDSLVKFVHCPLPVKPRNLDKPVTGVFVVVNVDATVETIVESDLVYLGEEYKRRLSPDKNLFKKNIKRLTEAKILARKKRVST